MPQPFPKKITLRILDGPDKGKEYRQLSLPISIGREPENNVPLNDERVSRYHCRILEDHGKVILTDVDSTNGTKLNGQSIWLGVLQPGDVISTGQTLMIVGTREEILSRLKRIDPLSLQEAGLRFLAEDNLPQELPPALLRELEPYMEQIPETLKRLHALQPPELPQDLQPWQAVQLADLLLYVQLRLHFMVETAEIQKTTGRVSWEMKDWQCLLDLYSRMTEYCKKLIQNES